MLKLAEDEFLILNYIDIKYAVSNDSLINFMELKSAETNKIISKLEKEHYVRMSEGLWQLTKLARDAVNVCRKEKIKALSQEDGDKLEKASAKMDDIGFYLKYTIASYQLRADGLKRIMESFEKSHRQLRKALKELAELFPHFKHYIGRFEKVFLKIKDGDELFIVNHPNSYYNIYYELRTDLMNFLTEYKKMGKTST